MSRRRKTKPNEDDFDVGRALRILGSGLLEVDGQPAEVPDTIELAAPETKGPPTAEEEWILWRLVYQHWSTHPTGSPLEQCQSCGAAWAIFRALDSRSQRRAMQHVLRLRTAYAKARHELLSLVDETEHYLSESDRVHREFWDRIKYTPEMHDHQLSCVLPGALAREFLFLARRLEKTDQLSLAHQLLPADLRQSRPLKKPRRDLLAAMQDELLNRGWPPERVVEAIDDGVGGSPKVALERLRKRRAARRPRKLPTPPVSSGPEPSAN